MSTANPQLSPEKWARIREIYAKVLEAPQDEQAALAGQLCEGDGEIEAEMKELLSAHRRAGSFLGEPAIVALNVSGVNLPELSTGTVLASRFHILRHLNTGGMGSVYEAWDSDLNEILALKTIRPEIASDPSVIDRFKEEVRQAHQVSHPNICRVNHLLSHNFTPNNQIWFLTMQLLRGETLSDRLRRDGPLSSAEALMLVRQMVSGLAEAHRHGIVHRDFKSGNVMLVEEVPVHAVITDFGLAAQATTGGVDARPARQGTPAYVAPEQWYDGVATPAADQYSLGIVMCEMLTGERPTPAKREGDCCLPARLPEPRKLDRHWEAAIRRCLEVRPEARYNSIDDILKEIDPVRRRRLILRWTAVIIAILSLSITGILIGKDLNQVPVLADQRSITPEGNILSQGPRFSHDGTKIVYVSSRDRNENLDVFFQSLPDGHPKRVTNDGDADERPAISPDGRLIAFESSRNHPGIYLTDVDGGAEKLIAPDGHEPSFSPDGRSMLYWTGGDEFFISPNGRIFIYDLTTGQSTQLAAGMEDARIPIWNSDGHHILFTGCAADTQVPYPDCKDWWVTSIDGSPPHATGAAGVLASQGLRLTPYFGGWKDNTVVFSASRISQAVGLWEIKLSPGEARVEGQAKQLIRGDNRDFIISSSLAGNHLATCEWHPAIHVRRIDQPGSPKAQESRITNDPEFDLGPSVSHNGRWLIFTRGFSSTRKIHLLNTMTGVERELPFEETGINSPIVDDSGTRIVFESSEISETSERGKPSSWLNWIVETLRRVRSSAGKIPVIWVASPDGKKERLCTNCKDPTGWMNESTRILYGNSRLSEVEVRDIRGGNPTTILSVPGGYVQDAAWSQESGYIAFTVLKEEKDGANRRKVIQIFTARYSPAQNLPDSHWIAITGASDYSRKPQWSGNGKTIYFLSKRDSKWCVWGQHFDPIGGRTVGKAFAVQHYHDPKSTPGSINAGGLNLSAAGNSLYLNVLETTGTIWVGELTHPEFFFARLVDFH